jgi:YhcH/YjgK/YiaL family protein
MIVESIVDLKSYACIGPKIARAVEWLGRMRNETCVPGQRYEIAAGVYALCSEYETKVIEAAKYESHRQYIDIQCLLSGREFVDVTETRLLKVTEAYDPEKDIAFHEDGEGHRVRLVPGIAAVLFPRDAHRPSVAVAKGERVKKIVVKISVD